MPQVASAVSAILKRVRKLTQRTAETLKEELSQIEQQKTRLTAHLDDAAERIRRTLTTLGHAGNGTTRSNSIGRPKTKRIRRSSAQLKKEAEAVVQLIRSKGADGISGSEIRKHHPKVGPDIKGFVQKFGGHKIKTTGKKASTRYLAT
jgi:chemotaxis regulatin CheY-phosphate phosphatase CheZ